MSTKPDQSHIFTLCAPNISISSIWIYRLLLFSVLEGISYCNNGWWLKNGTFFTGIFSVDKTIFGSNQWNSVVKQAILNNYGLWQAPMSPFWLVQEGFFLQAQKYVFTVGPKIVLAQSLLLCPRAHVGLLAIFRACTCVARTPKKSSMVWDCQNLLWSITIWTKLTLPYSGILSPG